MTISKEQLELVAKMASLRLQENVLKVGEIKMRFDKDSGDPVVEPDEKVRIVTQLHSENKEEGPIITIDSYPQGQQLLHIVVSSQAVGNRKFYLTLYNPIAQFITEGSDRSGSGFPPTGVIFVDEKLRIVEMDDKGKIRVKSEGIPEDINN